MGVEAGEKGFCEQGHSKDSPRSNMGQMAVLGQDGLR